MLCFKGLRKLRKVALCAVCAVLVPVLMVNAAVPHVIPFQGRLMKTATDPAGDMTFQVRFSFWSDPTYDAETDFDSTTGALVGSSWQEVQTFTTDSGGYFLVDVGDVVSLPTLDYNVYRYLQSEVKLDGVEDSNYFLLDSAEESPTFDRKNVYQSAFVQNSIQNTITVIDPDNIPYLNGDGQVDRNLLDPGTWLDPVADIAARDALTGMNEGAVTFVESEDALYLYTNGTWLRMGENIDYDPVADTYDAGDSRLTNLGTPTSGTDAATKNYVDSSIAAIPEAELWLDPVADVTARNALTGMSEGAMVFVTSTNALHLYTSGAWKQIGQDITFDELLGVFDLDNQRITNAAAPVNDGDLTNKGYVDTAISDAVAAIPDPELWLDPVANVSARDALTGMSEGAMVFVVSDNALHLYTGGSWQQIGKDILYNDIADNFDLEGRKLTNAGTPTSGSDVTTKDYVDSAIAAIPDPDLWLAPVANTTVRDALSGVTEGSMVFVISDNALHLYTQGAWQKVGQDILYNSGNDTFDLENKRITNSAAPVDGADLTNKSYVESYVSSVISGLGDPDLWVAPVADITALNALSGPIEGTVVYVEDQKALYVRNNGAWEQVGKDILYDTVESAFDLEDQRLMNAAAPTADGDVTNKAYVDSADANLQASIDAIASAWLDPVADLTALNALTGMAQRAVAFVASENALYVYIGTTWQRIGLDITHDTGENTFDFGAGRLINIADPVAGTDAVNKSYMETYVSNVISGLGDPDLWIAPVADVAAMNALTGVIEGAMVYVEGEQALYVRNNGAWEKISSGIPLDGGAYDFDGNRLGNLGGPVEDDDATTKAYVDELFTSIHGNGVYLGVTTQLSTNGSAGGYVVADQACQAEYANSHVCRTEEIFNTISTQDVGTLFSYTSLTGAWILEGPPGFTAPANDCNGLTDGTSDYLGAFWQFNNTTGGAGALSICSQAKPFACCR